MPEKKGEDGSITHMGTHDRLDTGGDAIRLAQTRL